MTLARLRLSLAVALAAGCSLSAQEASAPGSFTEPRLHFTIPLPPGLSLVPATSFEGARQKSKAAATSDLDQKVLACTNLPLLAHRATTVPAEALVVGVSSLYGDCLGVPIDPKFLSGNVYGIISRALERFGVPTLQTEKGYELDGNPAVVRRAEVQAGSNGAVHLFSGAACSLIQQNVLCIFFLTGDKDRLTNLLQTPVTLHPGATPVPLVPSADLAS